MTTSKKWPEGKFAAFDKMTHDNNFYGTTICKNLPGRYFPKKIGQEYKWKICAVYNSHIQLTIYDLIENA